MIASYAGIFVQQLFYVLILYLFYNYLKSTGKVEEMNKKRIIKGIVLMVLSIVLNIAETKYFGWNHTAQSTEEQIWDIITSIPLVISMGMVYFGYFPMQGSFLDIFTKIKKEVLMEKQKLQVLAIKRSNLFLKKKNGVYLVFWNKEKMESLQTFTLEDKNGDHREKVKCVFEKELPDMMEYEKIKNILEKKKES